MHYREVTVRGFLRIDFEMAADPIERTLFEIAPQIHQPVWLGRGDRDHGANVGARSRRSHPRPMTPTPEVERGRLQAFAGVVTSINCVLCAVIGIRLIRFAARFKGPEAWLGLYLLAGTLLGTLLSSAVYLSWADPRVALPPAWRPPLHALQFLANTAGMIGILMFTQRVFRPRARWALRAVRLAAALAAVAFVVTAAVEGFEVHVIPNPSYFAVVAARVAAMVWMTVESLLYFGQLRRRQRLGLADPLLVNRFLLWSIWAGSMSLMQLSDPIGRFWYWWITGTTAQWLPEVGHTIIVFTIATTSALGAVTAATLFLTFFPTAAYKRWVAAHAITQ